jgi:gliding motility-associated lipoprotein GldJ
MTRHNKFFQPILFTLILVLFISCNKGLKKSNSKSSHSTGWEYNNPENGGFEVTDIKEQKTGPGLVFIEGGTFVMGATQEDMLKEWNNVPRRVTVPSFYIDETEVSNVDYLEYLHWLKRVFGDDYPEVYQRALPDTLVWRAQLAYNEPLVEMYLRHPSYHKYPVVGVSWVQATEYCKWRTNRVNERLLIEAGVIAWDSDQKNENNFNTEAYLAGQYDGLPVSEKNKKGLFKKKKSKVLTTDSTSSRRIKWEDGILLPSYRLPTEAEWEYAALGLIGNTNNERIKERKTYPWNGNCVRNKNKKYRGSFVANFKRGKGDYMGVAGSLNDGADITAPTGSYWPNDYGLYNMAGNVSEWVQDVYRPLSFEDVADYSPYRGNVFTVKKRNFEGYIVKKDSLGNLVTVAVTEEENRNRRNYRKANNINYNDGDQQSSITNDWLSSKDGSTNKMYNYGVNSLISDQARVYKGGSWKDPAYYLSPGVRRFLDQNEASNSIGFRCAMSRMGNTNPK